MSTKTPSPPNVHYGLNSYEENKKSTPPIDDDIAIVGLACRFAGEASDAGKLWDFVLKGGCASGPFPADKFNANAYYHPDEGHSGTTYARGAYFVDGDITAFDSAFFTLDQNHVLAMDPQQRVLLESAYQALENAGIPMESVSGSRTSVFVGSAFTNDFLSISNTDLETLLKYKAVGTSPAILANRISWFYDLKGASMTVDTACSSSLVALHQACLNLKQGESDMAIVSGVNLIQYPAAFLSLSRLSFLSPDGKCYSFDHRANGYGRGEGVGTMILKPLSSALRDGNRIRAVVKATGANQDGRTTGITLPSATSQEALIREVYSGANLDPDDTIYVEAHGTGTPAGDPLEAEALARAFGATKRKNPLFIGSVKAAIGHTEGAAGIAGLIKATLALEAGIIPPMANFESPNPEIPFDDWNIELPTKPTLWPPVPVRQASVNSFGFGGANAHAVLQSPGSYLRRVGSVHTTDNVAQLALNATYPTSNTCMANGSHMGSKQKYVVVISSADEQGIGRQSAKLSEYINSHGSKESNGSSTFSLGNLAYSLGCKRSHLRWRSFIVCGDVEDLGFESVSTWSKAVRSGPQGKIGFVFTGQGAQWAMMGQSLLMYRPYQESIYAASKYMASLGSPWVLKDELAREETMSKIDDPFLSQSATTAVQMAVSDLLASWNIRPARVTGHSSGEIAAAYACGRISRENAWKAAYYRGYLLQKQTTRNGAMLAVGLSPKEVEPYLNKVNQQQEGVLIIACHNSPKNITVSGDRRKIDMLDELLKQDGIFSRRLKVDNAYHSPHMLEVRDEYIRLMGDISSGSEPRSESTVEWSSSVTGNLLEPHQGRTAEYWAENLVSPVRFKDSLLAMCLSDTGNAHSNGQANKGGAVFVDHIIEIGPHHALRSAIKETLASVSIQNKASYLPILRRNDATTETILNTAGSLFCTGYPVNLLAVNHGTCVASVQSPEMLVDLPPYEFNHSTSFWKESRLSKNLRFRQHPRHDLFGAPVLDWNPSEPRWRNYLRRSELPWLMHHRVSVGYLIMVLEASKQVATPDQTIAGFRFRNVSLKTALIVPDTDEGIEISLVLNPRGSGNRNVRQYYDFRIFSFNTSGSEWVEHCSGSICVEYDGPIGPVDGGRAQDEEQRSSQRALENIEALCQKTMTAETVYGFLRDVGMEFGPTFVNLDQVKLGGGHGQAVGIVTVPDVAAFMPKTYLYPHIIQPPTMDSMLHIFLSAMMDLPERKLVTQAMVPTFMAEVWISASTASTPGSKFICHGQTRQLTSVKWESEVSVWDEQSREARIKFKGVQMTPLGSSNVVQGNTIRNLCHHVKWELSVEHLTSTLPIVSRIRRHADESNILETFEKYQFAAAFLIADALKILESQPTSSLAPHHRKYLEWMKYQSSRLKQDLVPLCHPDVRKKYDGNADLIRSLYDEVRSSGPRGELIMRMGPAIGPIMTGQVDALELMFRQDDLMQRVYTETSLSGNIQHYLAEFLGVLRRNRTNLRVLEVGAGTGSATELILNVLAPLDAATNTPTDSSINKFIFTDISIGFFEKAKERFEPWSKLLEFKTLDIEQDPSAQGFEPRSFDIVVAANVLHATSSISQTLKHVRSLLKKNGKLLLIESTATEYLWSGLCFGLLPGWWLGKEDFRQWGPLMDESQWKILLKDNGFDKGSLVFGDARIRDMKAFVSTPVSEPGTDSPTDQLFVVCASPDQARSQFVSSLQNSLAEKSQDAIRVVEFNLASSLALNDAICIVVADLGQMDLSEVDEDGFRNLQHLLCTCKRLLWISRSQLEHPQAAVATGLIRSIRWERDFDEINFVTLECDTNMPLETSIPCILKLYAEQFKKLPEIRNGEFKISDGELWTNRLMDAQNVNDYVRKKTSNTIPSAVIQPFGQDNRALKLIASSPGMLNKLEFVDDDTWTKPLGQHDVEIEVRATSLNFLDIMVAMGEILDTNLGIEASGIVCRVGPAVDRFKRGDRVVGFKAENGSSSFRTFFRTTESAVLTLPDEVAFEDAVALSGIFCTVIYGLLEVARLSKGETILIHAGAGGTGQAAIQIAQNAGAEVFATVSTLEKRQLLKEQYGIPEDHIFSSRDLSFETSIMKMTRGKGVGVILNSLAGDALRATWKCIAPFGRFIELGKKDALTGGALEMAPFLKNATYAGVNTAAMMFEVPQKACKIIESAIEMFVQGKIRPPHPLAVYSFEQIEDAFRKMQSGRMSGKAVFKPNPNDAVPVIPSPLPDVKFSDEASYVLAGGLGGIGRSLASWMVSRGAKHLILLSRSGVENTAAKNAVASLRGEGCDVQAFACDISKKDRLQQILEECSVSTPPIKGCIQGAMVLQDSMFSNMSHKEFTTAILPKVQGTRNLGELLPQNMDFFIMLSSITGIVGNRGQANYAAGNVFQDSFARYLTSTGIQASSINLGNIMSVGYVEENRDRLAVTKDWEGISEKEMHSLVEHHIQASIAKTQTVDSCQTVTGLTPTSSYAERGLSQPAFMNWPLFNLLHRVREATTGSSGGEGLGFPITSLLSAADSVDAATSVVTEAFVLKLCAMMSMSSTDIDSNKPLHAYGIDSLVAVEIRNWIGKEMQADIPVLDILGNMTIADLSAKIATHSQLVNIRANGKV